MRRANRARKIAHPDARISYECESAKKTIAVIISRTMASPNATHTITLGRYCTSNIHNMLSPIDIPKLISKMSIAFNRSLNRFMPVVYMSLFRMVSSWGRQYAPTLSDKG